MQLPISDQSSNLGLISHRLATPLYIHDERQTDRQTDRQRDDNCARPLL